MVGGGGGERAKLLLLLLPMLPLLMTDVWLCTQRCLWGLYFQQMQYMWMLLHQLQGLADLDGEKQEVEAELQGLAEAAAKDLGLVLDKTLK